MTTARTPQIQPGRYLARRKGRGGKGRRCIGVMIDRDHAAGTAAGVADHARIFGTGAGHEAETVRRRSPWTTFDGAAQRKAAGHFSTKICGQEIRRQKPMQQQRRVVQRPHDETPH